MYGSMKKTSAGTLKMMPWNVSISVYVCAFIPDNNEIHATVTLYHTIFLYKGKRLIFLLLFFFFFIFFVVFDALVLDSFRKAILDITRYPLCGE